MIQEQQTLMLSLYANLYDLLILKDNMLRQIHELVDFAFIYEELKAKYCQITDETQSTRFGCSNIC